MHYDLCLQVINKEINVNKGELSREISENCTTFNVNKESKLYDFMMRGRFFMKNYSETYFINSVPTMITQTVQGCEVPEKFVVFSHCAKEKDETPNSKYGAEDGPALQFYDIAKSKEVGRILGGEALIDFIPNVDGDESMVYFLGNKEMMSCPTWGDQHKVNKEEDAEKWVKSADTDRKNAIVVKLRINLGHSTDFLTPLDDFRLL